MDEAGRAETLRTLDQREAALVRALLDDPTLLDPMAEAGLRTAIALARLHRVRGPDGDVLVEETVEPLRAETLKLLEVSGLTESPTSLSTDKLRPVALILREEALRTERLLRQRFAATLPPEALDREVRRRELVLACGGGGGAAFVYLGAFKLLEEQGLRPALIAGTSMGSVVGLFRARQVAYDATEVLQALRSLTWGRLFQVLTLESRYALPAALTLYLKAGIGALFEQADGTPLALADLPIPLICAVSGIRSGVLPRPLEFYERLLEDTLRSPTPFGMARSLPKVMSALMELVQISERLETIYLGLEPGTERFDAVDAAGFSSTLPGVIHYDVVRKDDRMHQVLGALFARHDLFRIADGSLVDNVPARAAWQGVQAGRIGTRNALVLALDGFAPKLLSPTWLPMQTVILSQVERSRRWAHLYRPFKWSLSPADLVPGVGSMIKAIERGREALIPDVPFLSRMMKPLPPLESLERAAVGR